jgi:hypothetical protein
MEMAGKVQRPRSQAITTRGNPGGNSAWPRLLGFAARDRRRAATGYNVGGRKRYD